MNQHRRDLPPLKVGQTVRMQPIDNTKEWKEGVVIEQTDSRNIPGGRWKGEEIQT